MAAEWAAALSEAKPESASELHAAADQVAPAAFQNFAPTTASTAGNDINMILDIPVQLTVELGARGSRSSTSCSSRRARWSSSKRWPRADGRARQTAT